MADLLTHYVSGRLAGAWLRDPRSALLLGLGALVPDLVGKPLGLPPFAPDLVSTPSHTVAGLVFACWGLALLFEEGARRRAFALLYAGSLLHVALDALKDYLGRGAVIPAHPFWLHAWEGGCYRSEDVLVFLPGDVGALLLLWILGRRYARRARSAATT